MIPFLFDDIKSLLISLCSRHNGEGNVNEKALLNFEGETNLLLPVDQIDIGFAAKSAINKSKASRQKI